MTPAHFEAAHADRWGELEALLDRAEASGPRRRDAWDGARLATLYRRSCEDLALAQARGYPVHMVQRLESATQRAHRIVYRQQGFTLAQLRQLAHVRFPRAVRDHAGYVAVATLLFVLPMLAVGWAAWRDPGFLLHLMDARSIEEFDAMYGAGDGPMGRERDADTDWKMFGFYIMNNIGVGFQCFAAGIFAGVGSAFFLVYNGLLAGGVGGYLVTRGLGENFLSFVVTHAAFELTAIVLAGAAGLRLGHAWVAPGHLPRGEALRAAAREAVVIVYGVVGMLVVAAGVEAFWSSARWVQPSVKFGVGGACWLLVIAYLGWSGRGAPAEGERHAG